MSVVASVEQLLEMNREIRSLREEVEVWKARALAAELASAFLEDEEGARDDERRQMASRVPLSGKIVPGALYKLGTTLLCVTMTYILQGRYVVCTVCGGVTTCW